MKPFRIALLGNPNSGKTSLFNKLTGLQQRVGNFPGVTVDKKKADLTLDTGQAIELIDFPGAYSFYPTSQDERVVVQTLANPADKNYPDAVIYVADVTKLEKHLLLFTQVQDLGLPTILMLNMADLATSNKLTINTKLLAQKFNCQVHLLSNRTGEGFDEMDTVLQQLIDSSDDFRSQKPIYTLNKREEKLSWKIREKLSLHTDYQALLIAHHFQWLPNAEANTFDFLPELIEQADFQGLRWQVDETMARFDHFAPIVKSVITTEKSPEQNFTAKVDDILTHRFLGPVIFIALMFLVFQAIFAWAEFPMDLIDGFFGSLTESVKNLLPAGWFTDLLTDGILAGLGGVVIFIPQIAILFFLISLLEESGYMARAAFMFDRLMQFFGLNGRSLVALISSGACAIPAIMSTRTISNWKERLITILVAPFISCSARIPVYVILIGFAFPDKTIGGIFKVQGLAFMGLYLLGIIAALGFAFLFKLWLKTDEQSYLMLELPEYRRPLIRNVGLTVWEKVKTFIIEAGKIILVISVILWALASYGPTKQMAAAETEALQTAQTQELSEEQTDDLVAASQLEASYAGIMGKAIEPAIAPLGFDWKMGIAIISSFAAREVFVGSMATIYSVGSAGDDNNSVIQRLALEVDPITGEKVYNQARSISLLLFYVFAMMCMSTLAVVKRETKSWKWPVFQFVFMTALAYLSSLLVYQLLS